MQPLPYGQVASELAQAPKSTEDDGRYGLVRPLPIAGLPGDSAKLVPTGGVDSVPTELVPTLTQPGLVLSMFGGVGYVPVVTNTSGWQPTPIISVMLFR